MRTFREPEQQVYTYSRYHASSTPVEADAAYAAADHIAMRHGRGGGASPRGRSSRSTSPAYGARYRHDSPPDHPSPHSHYNYSPPHPSSSGPRAGDAPPSPRGGGSPPRYHGSSAHHHGAAVTSTQYAQYRSGGSRRQTSPHRSSPVLQDPKRLPSPPRDHSHQHHRRSQPHRRSPSPPTPPHDISPSFGVPHAVYPQPENHHHHHHSESHRQQHRSSRSGHSQSHSHHGHSHRGQSPLSHDRAHTRDTTLATHANGDVELARLRQRQMELDNERLQTELLIREKERHNERHEREKRHIVLQRKWINDLEAELDEQERVLQTAGVESFRPVSAAPMGFTGFPHDVPERGHSAPPYATADVALEAPVHPAPVPRRREHQHHQHPPQQQQPQPQPPPQQQQQHHSSHHHHSHPVDPQVGHERVHHENRTRQAEVSAPHREHREQREHRSEHHRDSRSHHHGQSHTDGHRSSSRQHSHKDSYHHRSGDHHRTSPVQKDTRSARGYEGYPTPSPHRDVHRELPLEAPPPSSQRHAYGHPDRGIGGAPPPSGHSPSPHASPNRERLMMDIGAERERQRQLQKEIQDEKYRQNELSEALQARDMELEKIDKEIEDAQRRRYEVLRTSSPVGGSEYSEAPREGTTSRYSETTSVYVRRGSPVG